VTEASGILVFGYGNPGRLDDGLGPAFAGAVEGLGLPGVAVDSDYQLQVEVAEQVSRHRTVVFADADAAGPEPFWMERIGPTAGGPGFSTHSVAPGTVLALARDLFQAEPEAWLLGIRGYEFDAFGEGLTAQARANLAEAVRYLESAVQAGELREVRPEGAACPAGEEHEG